MAENKHTGPVTRAVRRRLWFEWTVAVCSIPQPKDLDTGDDMCCTDKCRSMGEVHECYFRRYEDGLKLFTYKQVLPGTQTQRATVMKTAETAGWQRVCVVDDFGCGVDGIVEGFRVLGLPPSPEM
jgi:hypothetical protein